MWSAEQVGDELQLVHHVLTREKRPAIEDLGEDASDTPDVNGGGVLGEERAAQLRSAVPACSDVVGPENGGRARVVERGAGQAEVADLELAICVCKDVLGLQVTVVHIRRVHVLQPSQELQREEQKGRGKGDTTVSVDE